MERSLNYERTFKIELLNEYSNGVYARLLRFIIKNRIDKDDKNNFYITLMNQFVEMLNLNLFKMSFEELDMLKGYWSSMDKYVIEITNNA